MSTTPINSYRGTLPILTSIALLVVVVAGTIFITQRVPTELPVATTPEVQGPFLAAAATTGPKPFRLSEIPSWLFLHVGIIAAVQVLSILSASIRASRVRDAKDIRVVQFLVEIPMYLGLFGTLLGVCLTQFVSGALTAPMAYLTTMSGIVLHLFGKLSILLPLPSAEELSE